MTKDEAREHIKAVFELGQVQAEVAAQAQRRNEMTARYLVKKREMSAARRNPFRPQQRTKRGPWRTMAEFLTYAEAKERASGMQRGMREVAIFIRGKCIMPTYYGGRFPEVEPEEKTS